MLKEGSSVYLRHDDPSGRRLLQLGMIAAIAHDRWTIDFENSELPIKTGDERLIYYHQLKRFVQRRVQVEEQSENGPVLRVVMELISDETSAETRRESRVSAIDARLSATLDTEDRCTVQDISRSGLGVISRRKHSIEQPLDVTLRYKDDEFSGRMAVQYGVEVDVERTRYGLRGLFEAEDGSPLRSGLMRTTLAILRQQLQPVSGAA